MQIILLTHERELERPTNTGKLALDACGEDDDVGLRRIVWRRTEPDEELLDLLKQPGTGLLYPSSEVKNGGGEAAALGIDECETFILLDGTWQEARKIYNRSPYLKPVPRVEISVGRPSRFTMRRNQREGCFCTAECIIEILRCKGFDDEAEALDARFLSFIG